jgi:hypothetical protein
MLHIVTPLYRYELLEKVYASIPLHPDILWHISKTSRRESLSNGFINTDPRIRLYEIDCADSDTVTKRNVIFDQITDGYFYLLDDDTHFVETLYDLYRDCSRDNFVGMVIGDQYSPASGTIFRATLPTKEPSTTMIDSGMVLCHHAVLRHVRWAWSTIPYRDRDFWCRCNQYWGEDAVRLEHKVISSYNFYGAKIRVRIILLGIPIALDIHNIALSRVYLGLGKLLRKLKLVRSKPGFQV